MTTEEEEGEGLPMPMMNLFSKETFLTKRLTHGRATSNVRLQVWHALGPQRLVAMVRLSVDLRINPDRI